MNDAPYMGIPLDELGTQQLEAEMSENAELKPCPFCASEAELCCALTGDWKSAIRCASCGAKTGWRPDDEAAIAAWNTRA